MLTLTIIKGPGTGQLFPLDKQEVVVGRETDGGLTLEDPSISRKHIRLILGKSCPEIEDLGSRNGTLLNGKPVSRHALSDGDTIEIGETTLRFDLIKTREEDVIFNEDFNATATIPMQVLRTQVLGTKDGKSRDVDSLNKARNALAAANRAGQVISTMLSSEELYKRLVSIILEEIPHVDRCAVLLKDPRTFLLNPKSSAIRDGDTKAGGFQYSKLLAKYTCDEQLAVLIQDMLNDERFKIEDNVQIQKIRSAICVPLISKTELLGVMYADTLKGIGKFTQDDLKLLAMIGLQASASLETARLYENLLAEKAALDEAHEELKQAQESLVQNEKMAAIGEFSAGIVHDLRNPLTVILGHAQFGQMQIKRDENTESLLEKLTNSLSEIEKGVLHSNHIIEQLLDFAKKSTPNKTDVKLNELILELLHFVETEAENSGVKIEHALGRELPLISLDRDQIKRAFINIIMNAIQAMPDGGIFKAETVLSKSKTEKQLTIKFSDTGIGMTPAEAKKVFEPFFTTKTKPSKDGNTGTGLGMAVTYGIIGNHNGTISVESEKGVGTTFIIQFPLGE